MDKDFKDFLKTLDDGTIAEITDKINNQKIPVSFSTNDLESSSKNLFNNIGSINIIITLDLLGRYHEWLKSDLQ